jgi:DMSO/TMAO reductase YedYZ molybdopterin-dependent catalytic subunit
MSAAIGTGALAGCADILGGTDDEEPPFERPRTAEQINQLKPGVEAVQTNPAWAWVTSRETLERWITPYESFYVLNHTLPVIPEDEDPDEWTVTIGGDVEERSFTVTDLIEDYPTNSVTHTMQCAGNGISYFTDAIDANGWGLLSQGFFTGVPLSTVFNDLGIDTSPGRWVTAVGGETSEEDPSFAQCIPMEKIKDDSILAYRMNGNPLEADHGYPIRLINPGWYGNSCVKSVERLIITDRQMYADEGRPMEGLMNMHQFFYRMQANKDDAEDLEIFDNLDTYDIHEQMEEPDILQPYTSMDMSVRSLVAIPDGSTINYNGQIPVTGVAWAGDDNVTQVEISDDGGNTWQETELVGPDEDNAWRQFHTWWDPGEAGSFTLASRATDDKGRTQPATISDPEENLRSIENNKFPWNVRGMAVNAYMPDAVEIEVT